MKRAFSRFDKLNIQKKITVSYAVLITNILLILVIGTGFIMQRTVINHTNTVAINDIKVVSSTIESKLLTMTDCSNMIVLSLNELPFLKNEEGVKDLGITDMNAVERSLYRAITAYDGISSALFLDMSGNIYSTSPIMSQSFKEHIPHDIISTMAYSGTRTVWFDMGIYPSFYSGSSEEAVVVSGKNVHDIVTGDLLGYLFVLINENEISGIYSDLGITKNSSYFLVNGNGNILSIADRSLRLSSFDLPHNKKGKISIIRLDGKSYVQNSAPIARLGVDLVYIVPINDVLRDMNVLFIYFGICAVIFFCFAIVLSIKLSRYLSKPILNLCETIHNVRTFMGSTIETVESANEIEVLSVSFNSMLDENNNLMEKIKDEYEKKRILQLSLVQSQIKAHFLYNALDTIYILAHLGRIDCAKTTTKALADFYRIALSGGEEFIPLGTEIRGINDYLKIQQFRYENLFEYKEDIDENLNHFIIPKLSIQPLVENSIYHGLKESERSGTIIITTEEKDGNIHITVFDNGAGIKKEKLPSLLMEEKTDSFGIKNVDTRLKLYFGIDYGLTIESEYGTYTRITMIIPKRGVVSQ